MIVIPENLRSSANNLSEFVCEIFPDHKSIVNEGMKNVMIDHDDQWMDWLTSRAIISSTNLECQEVNDIPIKQLEGQLYMNKSYDVVRNQVEAHKYPTEFLNSIQISGIPHHILELKKGASIMLLRNLDPNNGHVNGARFGCFCLFVWFR